MSIIEFIHPKFKQKGVVRLSTIHPTASAQLELPGIFNGDLAREEGILIGSLIAYTGLLYGGLAVGNVDEEEIPQIRETLQSWYDLVVMLAVNTKIAEHIVGSLRLFGEIIQFGDRNGFKQPSLGDYEFGYEAFQRKLQEEGDHPDYLVARVIERAREKFEKGVDPGEVIRRMDISYNAIAKYADSKGLRISEWIEYLWLEAGLKYETSTD